MKSLSTVILVSFSLSILNLIACSSSSSPSSKQSGSVKHNDKEHEHRTEGPHHGQLVELGDEEYHAEILHDDKDEVITIYILDGEAAKQIPISLSEITINVKDDSGPKQFQLKAQPDSGDPPNKSSRFLSRDKELGGYLDQDGAELWLVLTINEKSYRGKLMHDHDSHDH